MEVKQSDEHVFKVPRVQRKRKASLSLYCHETLADLEEGWNTHLNLENTHSNIMNTHSRNTHSNLMNPQSRNTYSNFVNTHSSLVKIQNSVLVAHQPPVVIPSVHSHFQPIKPEFSKIKSRSSATDAAELTNRSSAACRQISFLRDPDPGMSVGLSEPDSEEAVSVDLMDQREGNPGVVGQREISETSGVNQRGVTETRGINQRGISETLNMSQGELSQTMGDVLLTHDEGEDFLIEETKPDRHFYTKGLLAEFNASAQLVPDMAEWNVPEVELPQIEMPQLDMEQLDHLKHHTVTTVHGTDPSTHATYTQDILLVRDESMANADSDGSDVDWDSLTPPVPGSPSDHRVPDADKSFSPSPTHKYVNVESVDNPFLHPGGGRGARLSSPPQYSRLVPEWKSGSHVEVGHGGRGADHAVPDFLF